MKPNYQLKPGMQALGIEQLRAHLVFAHQLVTFMIDTYRLSVPRNDY